MREITIRTPAKINLSIDVTGRLENGYHTVEMIMQTISLSDTVTVEKKGSGISVYCARPYVPNDSRNIAWKAAEAFFAESPAKDGIRITINKDIPVAAGLAGGSTNAAGVLLALNRLYGEPYGTEKLHEIAKGIGADVPYCLEGGTALASGIGEKLKSLPSLPEVPVVLVKPLFPVSTAWVYKNLNLSDLGERPKTAFLVDALESGNISRIAANMRNVLESVTLKAHPILQDIINQLLHEGALGSRMSGSGPTVFGIFDDESKARAAYEKFSKLYENVYYTKTIKRREESNG